MRVGFKKCKPIPAPPRDVGLKSRPIPAPPPLRGGKNLHGTKRGGAGQVGREKIAIPTRHRPVGGVSPTVTGRFRSGWSVSAGHRVLWTALDVIKFCIFYLLFFYPL